MTNYNKLGAILFPLLAPIVLLTPFALLDSASAPARAPATAIVFKGEKIHQAELVKERLASLGFNPAGVELNESVRSSLQFVADRFGTDGPLFTYELHFTDLKNGGAFGIEYSCHATLNDQHGTMRVVIADCSAFTEKDRLGTTLVNELRK
jgi:hypothetical protein